MNNASVFNSHQISTSVLRIPGRVTITLIAPTVTVLTAVLVNKVSLEMEQFVKVWRILIQHNSNSLSQNQSNFPWKAVN